MTSDGRAMAYVDGFNLYFGMLRAKPNRRWLDLVAFTRFLLPGTNLVGVRYFTARVQDFDRSGTHQRQDAYLTALGASPLVSIHYGSFRVDSKRRKLVTALPDGTRFVDVWIPEEKGSDVNLASHLMLDAAKDRFDLALVVTNDSDLAEPVRLVTAELGKRVVLAHPSPTAAGSLARAGPHEIKRIYASTILKSQLPDPVIGINGRPISRPTPW